MYPRTFFDQHKAEPTAGTCFVIMPFAKKFTPTFKAIQQAIELNLGFQCMRTDELLGGGHIIEDILRGIASSEVIVADVTGMNANVYYELGIVHMSKDVEKVILLSQDVAEIPFDLRQFRHIIYKAGKAGLNALTGTLAEAVSAIGKPVHRIYVDRNGQGTEVRRCDADVWLVGRAGSGSVKNILASAQIIVFANVTSPASPPEQ
jgi:hypothetical protein